MTKPRSSWRRATSMGARTTTMVGLSSDRATQRGFGPFTPGFVTVPYGDAQALERAMSDRTAAVLLEPIQGEGGVWVPPAGYLRRVRELCDAHGVLFIADEIQTGLGRTGATLACDHEGVRPDLVTVGKPLSGGMLPLSALAGRREVMDVFTAGSHGSTFAGNPLACAVGRAVIELLGPGDLQRRATQLGEHLRARLQGEDLPAVVEVRGKGPVGGYRPGTLRRLGARAVRTPAAARRPLQGIPRTHTAPGPAADHQHAGLGLGTRPAHRRAPRRRMSAPSPGVGDRRPSSSPSPSTRLWRKRPKSCRTMPRWMPSVAASTTWRAGTLSPSTRWAGTWPLAIRRKWPGFSLRVLHARR